MHFGMARSVGLELVVLEGRSLARSVIALVHQHRRSAPAFRGLAAYLQALHALALALRRSAR